jgi:hypothetical protein
MDSTFDWNSRPDLHQQVLIAAEEGDIDFLQKLPSNFNYNFSVQFSVI